MTPCAIRKNKMTETAGSEAACEDVCFITNVNLDEVNISVPQDGSFVSVICSFYWYLRDNNDV